MNTRTAISRLRLGLRVLAILVLILFGCSRPARAMKLFAPTWFGLARIAPGIYVDKAMSEADRREVLQMASAAKEQLVRYYGDVIARPSLFFCSSEAGFVALGGTTQTGLNFGRYASVLSPRGRSVAIVAHEWAHAELYARLGGWWNWRRMPRWFDEGLAVTVSEEPRHSESVYEASRQAGAVLPTLAELETSHQWSVAVKRYRDPGLNPGNRAVVYAVAGQEVRGWFARVGPPGLMKFIGQIRSGVDFPTAYASAGRPWRSGFA